MFLYQLLKSGVLSGHETQTNQTPFPEHLEAHLKKKDNFFLIWTLALVTVLDFILFRGAFVNLKNIVMFIMFPFISYANLGLLTVEAVCSLAEVSYYYKKKKKEEENPLASLWNQ